MSLFTPTHCTPPTCVPTLCLRNLNIPLTWNGRPSPFPTPCNKAYQSFAACILEGFRKVFTPLSLPLELYKTLCLF